MRLYVLYAMLVAAVLIASLSAVPGLNERMRRWLTIAIAVFVMLPSIVYLIFGGG